MNGSRDTGCTICHIPRHISLLRYYGSHIQPERCIRHSIGCRVFPHSYHHAAEHHRPASTKVRHIIVEHTFVAAYWDDSTSHYIDPEHIRQLVMSLFATMPCYMEWYVRWTHLRIQNHNRLSPDRVLSSHPHIPSIVVLDVLDSYIDDDDPNDGGTGDTRFNEIADCMYVSTNPCLDFLFIIVLYYVFLIMYVFSFRLVIYFCVLLCFFILSLGFSWLHFLGRQ